VCTLAWKCPTVSELSWILCKRTMFYVITDYSIIYEPVKHGHPKDRVSVRISQVFSFQGVNTLFTALKIQKFGASKDFHGTRSPCNRKKFPCFARCPYFKGLHFAGLTGQSYAS
jgi:hypothetical protein